MAVPKKFFQRLTGWIWSVHPYDEYGLVIDEEWQRSEKVYAGTSDKDAEGDQDPTPQPCSPCDDTMVEQSTVHQLLTQAPEYQSARRLVVHNLESPSARELLLEASEVTSALTALRGGRSAR